MKAQFRRAWIHVLTILVTVAYMTAAQAQDPQVDAANPSSAEQGTIDLDVEISGSGFDSSAEVFFYLPGTSTPGGINVHKVKVRGPKKLIATINVDEDAVEGNFDIEVSLQSSGRRGRGTTLFQVLKKTSNGNNTVESLRLTFGNAPNDKFRSDPTVNAVTFTSMLCAAADSPEAQYWVADPMGGFTDFNCQGSKDLAAMGPGLTGPEGLWFTNVLADTELPADLPTSSRWLVLDFSGGIAADLDNDGILDPSPCHDIDGLEYTKPPSTDPVVQDIVPPIDPDPCIDNLQGVFRAGSDIFNMPYFSFVGGTPHMQIRIPGVGFVKKKGQTVQKVNADPAYTLEWDTLVVTEGGDGHSVTIACGNDIAVVGHTCRATLTRGGITRNSRYPDAEIIGVYEIPFSVKIQRVLCNADGTGCAVP